MATFYNELRFTVETDGDSEHLADCLIDILEHIDDLSPASDPDYLLTLSEPAPEVLFSISTEAETSPEALGAALALLRTAIHAVGGGTPDWESAFTVVDHTVRPQTELV